MTLNRQALLLVGVARAFGTVGRATKCEQCEKVASFPGSCAGEEEREPGTHCSRMRQVPLVTCILLRYTKTSSMHNMFGASVSEVYKIIRCQFDLKIDNLLETRWGRPY